MKKIFIRLILVVAMLLLTAVTAIIPSPYKEYVNYLNVGLFATVLISLICSGFYGALTGALCPVLLWILQPEASSFLHDAFVWIVVYVITALFADMMYRTFKSSVFAAIAGVLMSRILIIVVRLITCLIETRSYTIQMYLKEAYGQVWPGLLLTLILVPSIVQPLRKLHVLRFERKKVEG